VRLLPAACCRPPATRRALPLDDATRDVRRDNDIAGDRIGAVQTVRRDADPLPHSACNSRYDGSL